MVRKKPVRHRVRSHAKRNGTRVRDYDRGSGVRSRKPSKVVGKGTKSLTEAQLKSLPHFMMEIGGHGATDFNDWLKSQGYQVRNLTLTEIGHYHEVDEEEAKYIWEAQKSDSEVNGLDYGAYITSFIISRGGKPIGIWDYSKH